ncbi:hypothetical protein G6L37_01230 [Agrobacterium rubi]|nr:hypothetical protein [Agrobacterium rubi]NTF24014.1 hypothetical protein [Agrobacterium rubi]
MFLRKYAAALAMSAITASPVVAQEDGPETIESVGQEFIGVLRENGWKDARYSGIRGDGALFEITGVVGSRKAADGSAEALKISKLTVEGIDPGDRWIRAESVRLDGLQVVVAGNEVLIGAIYAKKPGLLDIDLGRPTAAFDNAIVTDVSWKRGGLALAEFSQMYMSGDRWIGEFGVPGRLDVTAKGSLSANALPFVPEALASGVLSGDFSFKTSVSTTRDELTVAGGLSGAAGSWAVTAMFTEFDNGLFRAWFDRENFDEKRSEEASRTFAAAFDKELAEVGLKSFEIVGKSDGSLKGSALSAYVGGMAGVLPAGLSGAAAALTAFAQDPRQITISGYSRFGVPVASIIADQGASLAKFDIRAGR